MGEAWGNKVRGRLTQHCTPKPTGTPTASTSVYTEAEGSPPGWGLLFPLTPSPCQTQGQASLSASVCHEEVPRPCSRGPPLTGTTTE